MTDPPIPSTTPTGTAAERVVLTGRFRFAARKPQATSAHRRMAAIGTGNLDGIVLTGADAALLDAAIAAAVDRGANGGDPRVSMARAALGDDAVAALAPVALAVLRRTVARWDSYKLQRELVFLNANGQRPAPRFPETLRRLAPEIARDPETGAMALAHAVGTFDTGSIDALLDADAQAQHVQPLHALRMAIARGDEGITALGRLLDAGMPSGLPTTLSLAAQMPPERALRTIGLLAARGGRVTARAHTYAQDLEGLIPPLVTAAEASDDVRVTERLLALGCSPADAAAQGYAPLHAAARFGRTALAARLLAAGADPAGATGFGWQPLHFAATAEAGGGATIRLLVAAGAPLDARMADGRTPLLHAALHGRIEAVRTLLALGADRNAQDGTFGGLEGHARHARLCERDRDELLALIRAHADSAGAPPGNRLDDC